MFKLWQSIFTVFVVTPPQKPSVDDPTIYRVETSVGKYFGKIIYQDDTMMKLKLAKPKVIKILKSNIERITIVQTELAQEYYQMHNTRSV
jgi:hypothetical protein